MPHDRSNMLEFALYRGRREESNRQPQPEPEPEPQSGPEEEVHAIVSCLEYLYGETMKLDRRMAAHLIGAAAEALRYEQSEDASRGGGTK